MIKKNEQRIIDKPTPAQIKALLAKAKQSKKKTQEKKKGSPESSPKKMDILLEKIEVLIKRQDRLESVYSKAVVTAKGTPGSKKKVTDQENQATKTNEQLLKEAELEQERAQGKQEQPGQQPGQRQGQMSAEQYEKLPDSEKVKLLEGQQQQGGQFQGEPQSPGKLTGQQGLYALIEIIKAAGPTIQTAIAKGGSNSESPLKTFLSQLSTYESIEKGVMDRFFNWMRMLSPAQKETTMNNIAASGPGKVEIPKTDEGRIKQ